MLSRSHGPPRSFSSVPFACLSFRSFRPHLGSFPSFPFARPECNRLSRSGRANRVVPVVRGSAVDRPVAPLLSHLVSAMLPFCPSLPSGWRQVRPRQGSGSTGRGRQSPREGAKSVVSLPFDPVVSLTCPGLCHTHPVEDGGGSTSRRVTCWFHLRRQGRPWDSRCQRGKGRPMGGDSWQRPGDTRCQGIQQSRPRRRHRGRGTTHTQETGCRTQPKGESSRREEAPRPPSILFG